MARVLDKRKFTFTWQIQNFSMCPLKFNEFIDSPIFTVERIENSEWQMRLYPKGDRTENFLGCYLRCRSGASIADGFKIGFSLSTFSDVNKRKENKSYIYTFKKNDSLGSSRWISTDDIFSNKEVYLPNDTLTVKCSIWRNDNSDPENNSSSVPSKSTMFSLPTALNISYESGQFNESTIVTRVEVQKRSVLWSIRNFSSIAFNETLMIRVPSGLKCWPTFFITFCKSATDQSADIEIRRTKTDLAVSYKIFMKCKVSVLYTPKDIDIYAEYELLFDSNTDHPWKFPSFIKLNRLEEEASLKKMCDVLHLQFEFSFSTPGKILHMEKALSRRYGTLVNQPYPIEEFRSLLLDGALSDLTVRAGDREFKVHKIILRARSPVFGAMFDNDMKEKETGIVDITDVDSDTMYRMLSFMYTNVLDVVEAEDALTLYSAADKYEVDPLKSQCISVLASSLSVSNVCEVLTLADQHNDVYLHDCAESFVHMNSVEVFKSKEWENFMKTNSTLAAQEMHKVLTN